MCFHDIPLVYASLDHSPCFLFFLCIQRNRRFRNVCIPGASELYRLTGLAVHRVDTCGNAERSLLTNLNLFFNALHKDYNILQAVGFSYAKRETNHRKQPSAFPSSMRERVTPSISNKQTTSNCSVNLNSKFITTNENWSRSGKAFLKS